MLRLILAFYWVCYYDVARFTRFSQQEARTGIFVVIFSFRMTSFFYSKFAKRIDGGLPKLTVYGVCCSFPQSLRHGLSNGKTETIKMTTVFF